MRVGEALRHGLAAIVERGDFHDPVLASHSITITEVRVSPDLRNATAFVVPLGGQDVEPVMAALAEAAPYLRKHLAATVRLKYMPRVSFKFDTSFDEASHIDSLLRQVVPIPAPSPEDGSDDDGA